MEVCAGCRAAGGLTKSCIVVLGLLAGKLLSTLAVGGGWYCLTALPNMASAIEEREARRESWATTAGQWIGERAFRQLASKTECAVENAEKCLSPARIQSKFDDLGCLSAGVARIPHAWSCLSGRNGGGVIVLCVLDALPCCVAS
jgi:hypothetical protein